MGAILALSVWAVPAQDYLLHTFKKIILTDKFYCEGISSGDFNRDGKLDVVAGPYWYEGPDFQKRYEYRPAQVFDPKGYSDNFLTFVYDFNQDGWPDVLVVDTPGKAAYWYENPQGKEGPWAKHLVFPVVDNESPGFGDLNANGKPELIFNTDGFLGYAQPDGKNPTQPWRFHPLSPRGKWHKYTHGLGFGDINGDGRIDFLEIEGWWEHPASLDNNPVWRDHKENFGEGGAQMLVYDVNGDGLNDVITCLNPHKYGLAWFEQVRQNGQVSFRKHLILGQRPAENKYGLEFTQMHALALADIDGDGLQDIVTGKRWWAHPPPTDPEADAPAVLYWFKLVRRNGGKEIDFVPYLIDDNSGVGTQIQVADINGDGLPDILVGNKKGCFVFLNQAAKVSRQEWEKAQPKPYSP